MKWKGRRQSDNVDDRRTLSPGKVVAGGGAIGIIFLLVQLFMGGDQAQLMQEFQNQMQQAPAQTEGRALTQAEEEMGEFVKTVLPIPKMFGIKFLAKME